MILVVLLCAAIHSGYIGSKVAVSLLAINLGASPSTIGVIAALYGVAPLVLAVHSGRLSDRVGVRLPLMVGAGLVVLAMLTGALFPSIAGLFVVALLMGGGFAYYNVSIQNLAGFIGGPAERPRNFAWLSMGYSISAFFGPMFAGFAIDLGGHSTAFIGFGLLAFGAVLVLAFTRRITGKPPAPPSGDAHGKTLDLLRDPPLRNVVIMSGLMVAAWEMFIFYMPLHGHEMGLSASAIGVVLGVYSVGAFFVRFLLPMLLKRASPARLLSVSMVIGAVIYGTLPWIGIAWLLIVASLTIGLVLGVCQPLSMTLAFERSPAGRTGEVTGVRLMANNVARVLVPVLAGLLGTGFGAGPVFWLNAINLLGVSWLARR